MTLNGLQALLPGIFLVWSMRLRCVEWRKKTPNYKNLQRDFVGEKGDEKSIASQASDSKQRRDKA